MLHRCVLCRSVLVAFTQQDVESRRLWFVPSATPDELLEQHRFERADLLLGVSSRLEKLNVSERTTLAIRYTGVAFLSL